MSVGVLHWGPVTRPRTQRDTPYGDAYGDSGPIGYLNADGYRELVPVTPSASTQDSGETSNTDLRASIASLPKHAAWVLALDTPLCLFHWIENNEIENHGGRLDRSERLFELESHLPWDAELMAADFQVGENGFAAIAVDADDLKPQLDQLREEGLNFVSVVPFSLLIARGILQSKPTGDHSEDRQVHLESDRGFEQLVWTDGQWVNWKWWPPGADEASGDLPMHRSVIRVAQPEYKAAFQVAQRHASGRRGDGFELLRGPLEPANPFWRLQTPLMALAVCAALMIATFVGGLSWRASRMEAAMTRIRDTQRREVQAAFPDRRIPTATLRWVRSEYSRQMGTRSTPSTDPVLGKQLPVSAVRRIASILNALPQDVRFQIESLELDRNRCEITMRVAKPTDAGRVVSAINAAGWSVSPPITSQIGDGVFESRIEADYRDEKPGTS